jgi:hypothetical protein
VVDLHPSSFPLTFLLPCMLFLILPVFSTAPFFWSLSQLRSSLISALFPKNGLLFANMAHGRKWFVEGNQSLGMNFFHLGKTYLSSTINETPKPCFRVLVHKFFKFHNKCGSVEIFKSTDSMESPMLMCMGGISGKVYDTHWNNFYNEC